MFKEAPACFTNNRGGGGVTQFYKNLRRESNTKLHEISLKDVLSVFGEQLQLQDQIMKHNRLTSGELLSNDRRAVGFVSS